MIFVCAMSFLMYYNNTFVFSDGMRGKEPVDVMEQKNCQYVACVQVIIMFAIQDESVMHLILAFAYNQINGTVLYLKLHMLLKTQSNNYKFGRVWIGSWTMRNLYLLLIENIKKISAYAGYDSLECELIMCFGKPQWFNSLFIKRIIRSTRCDSYSETELTITLDDKIVSGDTLN